LSFYPDSVQFLIDQLIAEGVHAMEISILLFAIVVLTILLGLILAVGAGALYLRSYPRMDESAWHWRIHEYILSGGYSSDQRTRQAEANYYDAFREAASSAVSTRQNFWTALIQFTLSIAVVVFITILLLLKIVTAEAGLPILAALGGAAISQGLGSIAGTPRPRTEQPVPEGEAS
jgi:predicted PurR-regulated permease PerM